MNAVSSSQLLPSLFISHGGGPSPFMDVPTSSGNFFFLSKGSPFTLWLKQLAKQLDLNEKPKAILVISAHWETKGNVKVYGHAKEKPPGMLYDYYGFPKEMYELKYQAPSDPQLAHRVVDLLNSAGVKCELELERGYDHGAFVPLLLMYPEAEIPVIQLSLNANRDAKTHFEIGRALLPLRSEGVLIIGSGFAIHDMSQSIQPSQAKSFSLALRKLLSSDASAEREKKLLAWEQELPFAFEAHRTGTDHFIPLFVAAGAAGHHFTASRLNNPSDNDDSQLTPFVINSDSYRFD